ncbi:unnamed protein product, partial [Discosporangium mesarthrocarpum]
MEEAEEEEEGLSPACAPSPGEEGLPVVLGSRAGTDASETTLSWPPPTPLPPSPATTLVDSARASAPTLVLGPSPSSSSAAVTPGDSATMLVQEIVEEESAGAGAGARTGAG